MKKTLPLLFCILYALELLAANEGRAIRSNWPCMDPINNCVGLENESITFKIILRFKPNQYAQLPPLFIKAHVNNSEAHSKPITIHEVNSLANQKKVLTSYTPDGQANYSLVNDIKHQFSFPMSKGTTNFDFEFSLITKDGEAFKIEDYPNLMAKFDVQAGWSSYVVDQAADIKESGNKKICNERICDNLLVPGLNLSPYPNPFTNKITVNYETLNPDNTTRIELIDSQGKTVKLIFRNDRLAGLHSFTLEAVDLISGLYVCRISNPEGAKSVKMLKSKP